MLRELTGHTVGTEEECLKAIESLHARGVGTVVVTSGVDVDGRPDVLACYASTQRGEWLFEVV